MNNNFFLKKSGTYFLLKISLREFPLLVIYVENMLLKIFFHLLVNKKKKQITKNKI